jgi:hypothetical protein
MNKQDESNDVEFSKITRIYIILYMNKIKIKSIFE